MDAYRAKGLFYAVNKTFFYLKPEARETDANRAKELFYIVKNTLLSASIKLSKHNNAAKKLESLFLVMYQITFVLFNL